MGYVLAEDPAVFFLGIILPVVPVEDYDRIAVLAGNTA